MTHGVEFDADGLFARAARASLEALRRAGAYIRAVARRKVKTGDDASQAGTPPHTREGALRRGILFGVEARGPTVVVGPAEKSVGTSMAAHEFGGSYRKERYPRRPLMGPSLKESAPGIAKMWENAVK